MHFGMPLSCLSKTTIVYVGGRLINATLLKMVYIDIKIVLPCKECDLKAFCL